MHEVQGSQGKELSIPSYRSLNLGDYSLQGQFQANLGLYKEEVLRFNKSKEAATSNSPYRVGNTSNEVW